MYTFLTLSLNIIFFTQLYAAVIREAPYGYVSQKGDNYSHT